MYYSSAAQPQPHQAAAYQNLPDNMGMGAGPATVGGAGATCEPQQGQQNGPPPSSSLFSAPPMLNLAKVSRNHEAQTTPRRAADAAYQHAARQQAHTQAAVQQQQAASTADLAAQQHAALKTGVASPRRVNVDATTEGISLAGRTVQPYSLMVEGSQFQQARQPATEQYQQYQQQARYVVPPNTGRPNPCGGPTGAFNSGPQSQPASARGFFSSRLPHVFGGSQQQQQTQQPAQLPATARQPAVSPYLRALPTTARRHQASSGGPANSRPQAEAASGAFNLPPLQLGLASVSGHVGYAQPRNAAHASQLATAAAVQLPGGQSVQHPHPQALPSARGGSKDDVYSRLSQGLPTVETARSARLQAARQAQPPYQGAEHTAYRQQQQQQQQVHSQAAASQLHLPPVQQQQQQLHGKPGGAQPSGTAAAMPPSGQRARALRVATGVAGCAMQVDSPTSSTGLTPRVAQLMDPSPCSPRYITPAGQTQHVGAHASPLGRDAAAGGATAQQAHRQPAQQAQQQAQLEQAYLQQVQQQQSDAGHLFAAFGGTEQAFASGGPPVHAPESQPGEQLSYGLFGASTGALPGQHMPLQAQLAQHGAMAAAQQAVQQVQQAQQPYQAPPQQYLYSQSSITAQFAKLHSGGPLEAGGFLATMPGGTIADKQAAMPQQGWQDSDAIRAVRRRSDEVLHPVFGGQQPQLEPHAMQLAYAGQAAAIQQVQQNAFAPGNALSQLPAGQTVAAPEQLLPALPYVQQGSPHQLPPMQYQPYPPAAAVYPQPQQCVQQQQQPQQQQQDAPFGQQQEQQLRDLGLPLSKSDLDLVAAVAEEVSVYDLQRQQELEHQQAAAAAAASRRASLGAAPKVEPAQPTFQRASAVAPAARRLSYRLPGDGPPSTGPVPPLPVSSIGSRPASVAAPAAVPTPSPPAEGERQPVTAAAALRQWGHLLSAFEQSEVLSYQHVWFVGRPGTAKIRGDKCSNEPNWGYDDLRGDYLTVVGDHIAYRYEVVGTLGRGSFGQVLRCKDHRTGTDVALKIIRNKKRFQKQAAVEAAILGLLREQDPDDSVNIVRTYESFTFRGHLCITFELLGMNLYEYIKACNFQGSSLAVVRRVAQQVLVTLRFLLRLQVVHCDLKPENVLLKERGKTAVKVIDFGSSCYVDKRMYTYIQSRFYRSPEVILGLPYGPPIDMWSLGCILAELLTGQPIFPGEDEREQLACIMELLGPPPRSLVEAAPRANLFFDITTFAALPCPPNSRGKTHRPSSRTMQRALGGCDDAAFIDFLKQCLVWDPARRMTPDQALQHRWITGGRVAPSRLSNAPGPAVPSPGGLRPSASASRDGSTGSMGSGLAALASGLLSGTARVAAHAGLL